MSYTEKAHASACGIMFAEGRCTCAVGEVERLSRSVDPRPRRRTKRNRRASHRTG